MCNFLSKVNVADRCYNTLSSKLKKDDKILDFGAGLGFMSYQLSKDGFHVSALEIDQALVKKAKENPNYHFPYFQVEPGDFAEDVIRESGKKFDKVLLNFVFHHIPRSQQKVVLKNIKQILKDDGEIIMIEPNPDNKLALIDKVWDKTLFKDDFYGYIKFKGNVDLETKNRLQLITIKKEDIDDLDIEYY